MTDQPITTSPENGAPEIDVYWIGWCRAWWPTTVHLRWLVTGRQADGQRATRAEALRVIGRRLRWAHWWHRPWQAEWDGCQRAVRGLTRRGVYLRAVRAVSA